MRPESPFATLLKLRITPFRNSGFNPKAILGPHLVLPEPHFCRVPANSIFRYVLGPYEK